MKSIHLIDLPQLAPAAPRLPIRASSDTAVGSDNELAMQITAGSESALAVLIARHSAVLRSVIYRVVNSSAESDEVLQDVFIHFWNHAGAYSGEKGKLLGWLITIARRRSVDRVRQRSAYQRATTRFEESSRHVVQLQRSSWIVDREVRNHELQAIVNRYLQLLPTQQSEVLSLSFLKGLTQREIAAHLSLPLGTIKTRLELGVRKLSRSQLFQQAA